MFGLGVLGMIVAHPDWPPILSRGLSCRNVVQSPVWASFSWTLLHACRVSCPILGAGAMLFTVYWNHPEVIAELPTTPPIMLGLRSATCLSGSVLYSRLIATTRRQSHPLAAKSISSGSSHVFSETSTRLLATKHPMLTPPGR